MHPDNPISFPYTIQREPHTCSLDRPTLIHPTQIGAHSLSLTYYSDPSTFTLIQYWYSHTLTHTHLNTPILIHTHFKYTYSYRHSTQMQPHLCELQLSTPTLSHKTLRYKFTLPTQSPHIWPKHTYGLPHTVSRHTQNYSTLTHTPPRYSHSQIPNPNTSTQIPTYI